MFLGGVSLRGGGEGLKAGLHSGQVLLPGAEAVGQLLPLLLAKGAMCTVAVTETTTTHYR